MTIRSFDSFEEMQAFIRENAERAARGLHDVQREIGFGDHWCRFVDIASREIEFGYVYTLDEVREAEIKAGATPAEADEVVAQTERDLAGHLLYGRAFIFWQPGGEAGHAHQAAVWPISKELFEAARDVGWDIDGIPESQKQALEAVYVTARSHALRLAEEEQ